MGLTCTTAGAGGFSEGEDLEGFVVVVSKEG